MFAHDCEMNVQGLGQLAETLSLSLEPTVARVFHHAIGADDELDLASAPIEGMAHAIHPGPGAPRNEDHRA